jgi:2-(1,2-epoxy-1,2-dihydrophenyl)acetyl-CoA isomerase
MYEHLQVETTNGVCTITLNRPEVYNAINGKIAGELLSALQQAGTDESVRVLIITGAGKGFCSGADLKEASLHKPGQPLSDIVRTRYNPIIRTMRQMHKPIIGKINGVAAGAGCSLALACDILIASEDASLSEIFINIGLVLDAGSSYFLPRLVGSARAFELATLGTKVPAREAMQLGLVNQVVPAAQLDETVAQIAIRYAQAPTKAIGMIKQLLNKSYHSSLEEMLENEAAYQEIAGYTHDHREGVQAFLEKRRPGFTGK